MRLLICDDKKIDYFYLPNEIKEYFSINYYYSENSNCEILPLYADNNIWTIDSNENMQIYYQGKKVELAHMQEYSTYILYFADINKYVNLFIFPDIEKYSEVTIENIQQINISNSHDENVNILYNSLINYNLKVVIQNINGAYIIKNLNPSNNAIYINGISAVSAKLNLGDVIFLLGLKIIWMGNYFMINSYENQYTLFGLNTIVINKPKSIEYTPVTEVERNSKIFNENQIFSHTPRIQRRIKKQKIKIDVPPAKEEENRMPIIVTLSSSIVMGLTSCFTLLSTINYMATSNSSNKFHYIIQILIGITMLVSSLVIPLIVNSIERKIGKKKEEKRIDLYTKYLNKKYNDINKNIKEQEEILHESNLTLKEIQKRIYNRSEGLWYREILDDDFLTIRLGIGNMLAEIDIDKVERNFELVEDKLLDMFYEISEKDFELNNVPISISMVENIVLPFIINIDNSQDYINGILLQLIFYYCPMDLKIVCFTNKINESKWEYIKYLPHCWSINGEKRFFAVNDEEKNQISIYLEQIYNKRIEKNNDSEKSESYKKYSEYYLIITDDYNSIKNLSIINRIVENETNIGFSLLIFEKNLKNLPSKFKKFVDMEKNYNAIHSIDNDLKIKFEREISSNLNIREYSKIISNIPVIIKSGNNSFLPDSLNFLEMYNAGRVDHLNILQRWKKNDPTVSLNVQIGVRNDKKPIGLDLHEKYHGPHGLIAGTTGSGKSEFIITYILAMAINYSPLEVQFVLIDYKGGGLAGAFENREKGIRIPHLIGTITNLDTSEMNRTLVSINSEMKRRQREFNKARDSLGEGTIDIYKYQKMYRDGIVKEPISHLFIICDEFAELKQQQPDFMDELISTSRIGRSLGVHLILATQKPSGVVNDQIWSNSRFRICLKVQNVQDSKEMLKKEDAAYIKESGRFYLQVGNDEIYELGQSGWSGAKYIPMERVITKIDDSIDFISNDGIVIKSVNDEIKQLDNVDHGEQLTNIVKYLYDIAIKEDYEFKSLWLPSISGEIFISNLIQKYKYNPQKDEYKAIIGEYDKPAKQFQDLFLLDMKCKNTIVFGIPNSGKENLLYSIIYSLSIYHTPEQINFYIIDFGTETLRVFTKFPTVGEYITSSEMDKIDMLFQYLQKEIVKRKSILASYSGSYDEYCKSGEKNIPLIVIVLNGYDSFVENSLKYEETLTKLFREGSKCGIVFVMTVVSNRIVRSHVLECFVNKIMMQVNDPIDYRMILNIRSRLVPKKIFGRGITIIDEEECEFQTAFICERENINSFIKETGKKLFNYYKYKVSELKVLPSSITFEKLEKYAKSIDKIPIGYTRDQVELAYYDFTKNKTNLIIGKNIISELNFMCSIIDLIDSLPNIKLNIFDFISCVRTDGNAEYYDAKFEKPFKEILNYNSEEYVINVCIGINAIGELFTENESTLFNNIMDNIDILKNQTFIIFDDYEKIKKIEKYSWYNNLCKNSGIWFGKDIDEQEIFALKDLKEYDVEEDFKQLVYIINDSDYVVVKGVGGKEGEMSFE